MISYIILYKILIKRPNPNNKNTLQINEIPSSY